MARSEETIVKTDVPGDLSDDEILEQLRVIETELRTELDRLRVR